MLKAMGLVQQGIFDYESFLRDVVKIDLKELI